MAQLQVDGDSVTLHLTDVEKAEALHDDLRFPRSAVASVEVLEHALAAVHGVRSPGAAVVGVMAVGTYRDGGTKTFAAVHHHTPMGVRVTLQGTTYDELVIGCDDPSAVAAALRAPR